VRSVAPGADRVVLGFMGYVAPKAGAAAPATVGSGGQGAAADVQGAATDSGPGRRGFRRAPERRGEGEAGRTVAIDVRGEPLEFG
jgi:hypothetical protein